MLYGLLKGSYKDFIKAGKNDRKNRAFCMSKIVIFLVFYLIYDLLFKINSFIYIVIHNFFQKTGRICCMDF